MAQHPEWVMDSQDFPVFLAPNKARRVNVLVSKEHCDAQHISAGLFWLAPGRQTDDDVHPDAEEIYYVVSGTGRLVMDGEEFRVSKGNTVFIPAGVNHQSFNDGEEDLCYFYAFSPPPSGKPKQEVENWTQIK